MYMSIEQINFFLYFMYFNFNPIVLFSDLSSYNQIDNFKYLKNPEPVS